MKKLAYILSSFILLTTIVVPTAFAQRESVQFDQPVAQPTQSTSGYTDENGRPLSIEEYEDYRKEMSKGIFEKYPVITFMVLGAVIGGLAAYFAKKNANKKANKK